MGYGALQHFWYGSPWSAITEFSMAPLSSSALMLGNPPDAVAGPPVTIAAEQQGTTVVAGSVTDPDPGPLYCRWLEGERVLMDWGRVGADGGCPLPLGSLPPFPVGSYPLTIEGMDEDGRMDRDATTLTVVPAPEFPSGGDAGLTLVKTAEPATAAPNQQVTYRYTVTNSGEVPLDDVVVVDDNGTAGYRADDFTVGRIERLLPGSSVTLSATAVPSRTSIVAALGAAGPSAFAVLSLGGDAAHKGAGINCSNGTVNGNAGIASFGTFKNSAPCTTTGNLYRGTNLSYSGPGKLRGSVVTDEEFMKGMRTRAFEAAAFFAALPPTPSVQQQFPSDGQINGTVTITGTPGFNVLNLRQLRLNGNLKLTGPAGTQFVFNITDVFDLHSGNITVAGGGGVYDVVYNITVATATVKTMVPTTAVGVLLAPNNSISPMDSANFYGSIIGGYNKVITLMSGTRVVPPATGAPTVTNTATATAVHAGGTVSATATATVTVR